MRQEPFLAYRGKDWGSNFWRLFRPEPMPKLVAATLGMAEANYPARD
ncbi:MAG: hypothetical protein NTY19_49760 [Planctomycetota bacterium]|nr:hypothetical protein [Planctomycetota bacterium]